jgi:Glyoxalase-like domain
MAIATYKDLCVDAVDTDRMSRFWGAALALEPEAREGGLVKLVGRTPEHTVWVVPVPEQVTVKQRAHLDLRAASAKDVEALGATVVDTDSHAWVLMKDPEGGELCVFESEGKEHGLYELVVDTDGDPQAIAGWWAEALGATLKEEKDFAYLDDVPGLPYDCLVFQPVSEPKTVKNRIHVDVWGDVAALRAQGATVLREPDHTIDWTIMADPDGNEFCVFTPDA